MGKYIGRLSKVFVDMQQDRVLCLQLCGLKEFQYRIGRCVPSGRRGNAEPDLPKVQAGRGECR